MRNRIARKMEEMASQDKFRLIQYPALRKEFLDILLTKFLELLDSFQLGGMKRGSWEWAWRKGCKDPRFKKLRNSNMRIMRNTIKYAQEHDTWDGVTLREYIKYMTELEEERGTDYASVNAIIVYTRR
jgi:hypothetical protein